MLHLGEPSRWRSRGDATNATGPPAVTVRTTNIVHTRQICSSARQATRSSSRCRRTRTHPQPERPSSPQMTPTNPYVLMPSAAQQLGSDNQLATRVQDLIASLETR